MIEFVPRSRKPINSVTRTMADEKGGGLNAVDAVCSSCLGNHISEGNRFTFSAVQKHRNTNKTSKLYHILAIMWVCVKLLASLLKRLVAMRWTLRSI